MDEAGPRRPVHLLPTLLAVAALLAGCAGPSPTGPAPSPPPPASVSPLASAEPSASAGPTASPRPDGWTPVSPPDLPAVATLEPVAAGSGAVALDTTFRLRSLDGRPPAELAQHLLAQPALAFTVISVDGDTALLRPTSGLQPRTTYRISLARADGTTEAAWVAQAAGPLQVTDTVPGDASTRVPRNTGIEVTFDQHGVTIEDLARYFSVQPSVQGRFVAAGRTIAFVPDTPLAGGRLYTVTVRRGLPLAGTGQVLDTEVMFRFETAAKAASPIAARFPHALVEASTSERAAVTILFDVPDGRAAPRSVPITVHQVVGLDAAEAALASIAAAPEWTVVSATEAVPTAGLRRVFAGSLRMQQLDEDGGRWLTLPVTLPAGWYVITERWAGIPRQALLQVSDIATFALVAADRTAVWTNDLRSGGTAAGATVTLAGRELGRTDERGLLLADTPASLAGDNPDRGALLVVRHGGQTAFRRIDIDCAEGGCGYGDESLGFGYGGYASGSDEWWRLLFTDRVWYRSTDTINAWGMARNRDTGRVPASVTFAVRTDGGASPIVSASATPDGNGAFAARLALRELPIGSYQLDVDVDGATIGSSWFEVATITKPAWQLAVDTDRHAAIVGDTVTALVSAHFFEGTPVAGARIALHSDDGPDRTLRTNTVGEARTTIPITGDSCEQECWNGITVYPEGPEEGTITASTGVNVFAASAMVDAKAELSGTRLLVTGKVSDVVLSRYERAGGDAEDVDPRGAGRARARVRLQVTEAWTVEVKVGTKYDFITKKVVPVYESEDRSRIIAERTVTAADDGTYQLRLDVPGGRRGYVVTASYVDERGRRTMTTEWADDAGATAEDPTSGSAELVNAGPHPDDDYTVGETIRVRFRGEVAKPAVERYLYAIAQRGLRYVTVGTTSTFRTTFEASSLPSISITGVRFNGKGYEMAVNGYRASVDVTDRRLTVQVVPERDRYAPGDTASVAIRTLGPGGSPVSASVYVSAVDEKLYAMDAAYDPDPLGALYASVSDGLLAVVASHRTPADDLRDGRDTTGGGDGDGGRSDFRDWLIATLVTTDSSGRATVRVPLSDDLTSWRVNASALDGSLRAGFGSGRLAVGIPFFVEATIKAEYLAADRPVLRVRGFGTGLAAGDEVTFAVSSDTLPMARSTARAKAFQPVEVDLPALSVGTHTVRIEATATGGLRDTLVRTFRVVDSRTSRLSTTWAPLGGATGVDAGVGTAFTGVTLVDAGRGRVIPILYELAGGGGVRADQILASALANRVLADSFGIDPSEPIDEGALNRFSRETGLAVVAQGSAQLEVTALAAMTGDPRLDPQNLRAALESVAYDERARRERRLVALAGLARLGEPVLGEVRAAASRSDLTLEEQVTLSLAALDAGDEGLAGRLERAVLRSHGVARGPWLRVETGSDEGDAVQTARLAIVAASLGDPVAADMDAWLVAHLPRTTVVDLERALAARGWARRIAGADAVAAVTVDGSRREVTIRPGEPFSLQLTRAQAASARLEPVSGSVLVVTSREVPLDPAGLTRPGGVKMTRTVSPSGAIGPTDRVVVTLRVTLGTAARQETWRVVDLAPSGLTPVWGDGGLDQDVYGRGILPPDWVDGQRVEFSVGGSPKTGTWTLRYVARVVTPGTYRWEPTVLQATVAPDHGLALAPTTVTIRRLGS